MSDAGLNDTRLLMTVPVQPPPPPSCTATHSIIRGVIGARLVHPGPLLTLSLLFLAGAGIRAMSTWVFDPPRLRVAASSNGVRPALSVRVASAPAMSS